MEGVKSKCDQGSESLEGDVSAETKSDENVAAVGRFGKRCFWAKGTASAEHPRSWLGVFVWPKERQCSRAQGMAGGDKAGGSPHGGQGPLRQERNLNYPKSKGSQGMV